MTWETAYQRYAAAAAAKGAKPLPPEEVEHMDASALLDFAREWQML